jgi:PBP1b-binding outer membrane lipoprotein LpoB
MKKAIPVIIIILILSLLVSGCLKQATTDLTNAKKLIDKQFSTPTLTPTPTPTITPTNTSTPTPTSQSS